MKRQPRWQGLGTINPAVAYVCGHCTHKVASSDVYLRLEANGETVGAKIVICNHCNKPTFMDGHFISFRMAPSDFDARLRPQLSEIDLGSRPNIHLGQPLPQTADAG